MSRVLGSLFTKIKGKLTFEKLLSWGKTIYDHHEEYVKKKKNAEASAREVAVSARTSEESEVVAVPARSVGEAEVVAVPARTIGEDNVFSQGLKIIRARIVKVFGVRR